MNKSAIASCLSLCLLAVPGMASAAANGFTNSIGMEFVKVQAGSFVMGSKEPKCPADDPFTGKNEYLDCMDKGPKSHEKPAHQVTISQDFYMGKYEVTQAQWYTVMGNNPSQFLGEEVGGDSRNHPVEQVSWNDVQTFITKLNAKEGKNYRLPTEAEWEYACRSGGKDEMYCGGNDLTTLAWYEGNSGMRTHQVGTKRPNGLGLNDMSGNVWEWCGDRYLMHIFYYKQSPKDDPQGPSEGFSRVIRGGSWFDGAGHARAAARSDLNPDYRPTYRGCCPPAANTSTSASGLLPPSPAGKPDAVMDHRQHKSGVTS